MVKRKRFDMTLIQTGDFGGDVSVGEFTVTRIPMHRSAKQFLHFRMMGDRGVLLDAMKLGEPPCLMFDRLFGFTHLIVSQEQQLDISRIIHRPIEGESYFHFDEVPGDRWQLTWGGSFGLPLGQFKSPNCLEGIFLNWK